MSILVLNAGSTSLKFELFDAQGNESLLSGTIEWPGGDRSRARIALRFRSGNTSESFGAVPSDETAVRIAIGAALQESGIDLVAHRVVYGGTTFQAHRLIDAEVKKGIKALCPLAPLHNPPALAAINEVELLLPGRPQVAVFDTAFFAQLPARAYLYPCPYEWYAQWGIRRIGFHGLSNTYCAQRASEMFGPPRSELRLITCHLGGGCSATAVRNGVPVSTTMGFTPMEGLMMGTRSGSIDPGVLLHLQRQYKLSLDQIDHALNCQSGLLGISGISADLAQIETARRHGDERAQLAFEIFADRVRSAIGSLAVTIGGVDALVFTDRMGEHSTELRSAVCDGLQCLSLRLDPEKNRDCRPDMDIAAADSSGRVLVIHTREELMMAREARQLVSGSSGDGFQPAGRNQRPPAENPENGVGSTPGKCRG